MSHSIKALKSWSYSSKAERWIQPIGSPQICKSPPNLFRKVAYGRRYPPGKHLGADRGHAMQTLLTSWLVFYAVLLFILLCAELLSFRSFSNLAVLSVIAIAAVTTCREVLSILMLYNTVIQEGHNRSGTFIVVRLSNFSGFQGVMFLVPSYRYSRKANQFNILSPVAYKPIPQCPRRSGTTRMGFWCWWHWFNNRKRQSRVPSAGVAKMGNSWWVRWYC